MRKQTEEGGIRRKETELGEGSLAGHFTELIERHGKENLDKHLLERLENDWDNQTMDYNRMNFLGIFVAFKCDIPKAVTHWRIAKIMEGISICSDQLKITDGISPIEVPEQIYAPLKEGLVNEKSWPVRVVNPEDENEIISTTASMADFAHFVDLIKTNRELGSYRFDMRTLAFRYFTGQDLKKSVARSEDGKEVQVDILSDEVNPRDDYKNLAVDEYLKFIEKDDVQAGLQMLAEWRYQSDGHREMAGHAVEIQIGSSPANALFIPLCGRMAAKITLSDLLKQDKSGMMGQPQEVAEIDEEKTGAFIKFNLVDLAQRRRGGDIRNINKSQRMSKAMCGLTLNEEANAQIETVRDAENKETKEIFLCGKKLDGQIIKGMQARYDASMKRVRGFGLKKEEAADMVMTDVIIPCILNNPNDWLTGLSVTYGVGGNKGAQSLLQNREVFQGFVVNAMCRNMEKEGHPIELMPFRGFNDLWDYVTKRVAAGHIDQPNVEGFVARGSKDIADAKDDRTENEYYLETISDLQGSNTYKVLEAVLGDKTEEYVGRYVAEGVNATFDEFPGQKKKVKNKKVKYDFDSIIGRLLLVKLTAEDPDTEQAMEKLYEITLAVDTDTEFIVRGFVETLKSLSDKDRQKIHL